MGKLAGAWLKGAEEIPFVILSKVIVCELINSSAEFLICLTKKYSPVFLMIMTKKSFNI